MNIQQEPEHTPPMQWWKKILILFLMIACIASAAYHHKDIDTSAVAANSVSQKTPQVQPTPQEPTEEPEKSSTPAVTDFSDVALLGNSYIDGFHIYNSLPGADCLYRVGLSVKTAFEKPMLGEQIPVIDKLLEKQYAYIFLTFGENELGWQYPEIFIEDYRKLIETVKDRQPNAKLYIQSILPVSAEVSEKNEDNTNNERIREYNELLRALAQEMQIFYLDVAAAMQDAEGNLPTDAATDGIHPGQAYNKKWADLIAQQVTEGAAK
ncbi:MAG: hypothetical protein KHY77_07315 [Butyricicoccus pullicaecorum]|nr:hypothetical protein [Butyricicoccus pullicaecorum]